VSSNKRQRIIVTAPNKSKQTPKASDTNRSLTPPTSPASIGSAPRHPRTRQWPPSPGEDEEGGAMDDGVIQEEPPPSARFLTPTRSGGTRWVDGSEVDSSESAPSWSLEDERSAGAVSSNGGATAASRVSSGAGGSG